MLLGTLNSSRAFPGAPLGALGHLSGGLRGHGGPIGNVWGRPERGHNHFKFIEKPLVFIAFLSIEVIWNLFGGIPGSRMGPREVFIGINLAQGEDIGGYFLFSQRTKRGQRPLTFKGWWVNGR